jgi:CRP/FNR family cyclic AMP-dependent transcriptional regulator
MSAYFVRGSHVSGAAPTSRVAMSEKIWFLKRCNLFAGLTDAQRGRLESHAVLRNFQPGEMVYFPSEPGQCVLLLAGGRVKIKALAPDGRETIFAFIEEGELFGELALVDTSPRNDYAEVVVPARVLALPREDVLWLMNERPEVALSITKLMGFRLRRIENRLRNIVFCSNRQRLVSLLTELLESHGQRCGQAWELRLRLSHQELASLIGATRETVTLTLGRMQREKLIVVQRRRIFVLDRARLVAEQTGAAWAPVKERVP